MITEKEKNKAETFILKYKAIVEKFNQTVTLLENYKLQVEGKRKTTEGFWIGQKVKTNIEYQQFFKEKTIESIIETIKEINLNNNGKNRYVVTLTNGVFICLSWLESNE